MYRYTLNECLEPLLKELRAIRRELEKLNGRQYSPPPVPVQFPAVPSGTTLGWVCACGQWVPDGANHTCVTF